MTNVLDYAELTTTHHMIDDDIAPQDLAMDSFRKSFRLVCNWVTRDGMKMYYNFKNLAAANVWKANAHSVITGMNLPLVAKVDEKKMQLKIIYKPD